MLTVCAPGRISAVPEFPGLRRFPNGPLMKIYLAAVAGYLPSDMIKCLAAFMEFCYLVRRCRPSHIHAYHRNAISAPDLIEIQDALDRFHRYCQIFIDCEVRVDISLPRQHSLKHYIRSIRFFGSLNGLCSSITESKHIKAVKEPWRRSSRFNALSQMLRTLVRLDKLAALRVVLTLRGMMTGTTSSYTQQVLTGEQPQVEAAAFSLLKTLQVLAAHIQQPQLPALLCRFLQEELNGAPDDDAPPVPLEDCPVFGGRITVHHSAIARFYAPSDLGGAGGMYREHIRSNPNWHGYPRRDTVLVDVGGPVMRGLVVGRALLFFSFAFADRSFECALVNWFVPVRDVPDPDTGMWVVKLERDRGIPTLGIIPVDAIARAAHLIGVYGTAALPEDFHFSDSLDAFNTYFVNPYADHHMHEFLA
ncbi:hypothetical protein GGX14DRAFT_644927 [Mycena pura]|uniref:Uncharacterized protein n=1 Tax=Mycena pura TaxID=153505 RepID=A0AAD6Y8C7_9AGAR|nr:hypothetical protein GGX14DRAFT_644927 [Mycena pura]